MGRWSTAGYEGVVGVTTNYNVVIDDLRITAILRCGGVVPLLIVQKLCWHRSLGEGRTGLTTRSGFLPPCRPWARSTHPQCTPTAEGPVGSPPPMPLVTYRRGP